MGAGQSSGRDTSNADVEVKTSYYELLGVERQATEDELKKAYRKKALELHPDRNYGKEEEATKTFAEVQAAYEVLSDPQERAWYDSHESAILRGDDGAEQDGAPTYQNVKVTTADDLARMVRKFNNNVEFSDSPSGFFGFVRETFDHLAKEEEIASNWENVDVPDYPTFGHKDDEYDDVVKRFYSTWSNFSTAKSFAWRDKYKLSEAPDRWYRRRMEKENKAFRQEGIKEFNDAVRSLVAFVRKRDPRYIPSTQSEAERQKTLRDAAAAQAARARAVNLEKMNDYVPEWVQEAEEEEEGSEEEEAEQEVFECVACNKVFKSEKQWEAHEKSKKHQKALHALRKKMRKENAHLDLDESQVSSGIATPDVQEEEEEEVLDDVAAEVEDHEARTNSHVEEVQDDDQETSKPDEKKEDAGQESSEPDEKKEYEVRTEEDPSKPASDAASDSEDSDYASRETIQARLQSTTLADTPPTTISEDPDLADQEDDQEAEPQPAKQKMGKAAQKRAKKAAAAAASEETANTAQCGTCNATFPSKTRLHQHIKDHGHATLKPVASSAGKGKKGKGR